MKNLFSINSAEVFWLRPIAFHIDEKLRVSLFYPQSVSLYELLHTDINSPTHFNRILKDESEHTLVRIKYEIACRLAKIMLTIHSLSSIMHHGHLTSHNIFVSLKKIVNNTFEIKVRIGDIELFDFMEYCNIFLSYRMTSVWSAPEALQQPKRIAEMSWQLDVYSFGMILWELWHQAIPFDNDISQAQNYVCKEDARPKIITSMQDNLSDEGDEEMDLKKEREVRSNAAKQEDRGHEGVRIETQQSQDDIVKAETTFCDEIITRLIRKCWQ